MTGEVFYVPWGMEKYDPAFDRWSAASPMSYRRCALKVLAWKVDESVFDAMMRRALQAHDNS
jgi:hypothetical protein